MMKKKMILPACILALALMLTGCGGGKVTAKEVTDYTQWSLDALYLGEFPEEYMTEFNTDVETETEGYLEGIAVEVEFLSMVYELEDLTEDDIARLTAFYIELYSNSKFTVGTAVEVPDAENTFAIEVNIEPITLIEKIDVALEESIPLMEAFFETEYMVDVDLDDGELYDIYNELWNELIISICEEQLAMGAVTHGEAIPVMVQIVIEETETERIFGLSDTDIALIDQYIIDYN